jgi:hypothetical protein
MRVSAAHIDKLDVILPFLEKLDNGVGSLLFHALFIDKRVDVWENNGQLAIQVVGHFVEINLQSLGLISIEFLALEFLNGLCDIGVDPATHDEKLFIEAVLHNGALKRATR